MRRLLIVEDNPYKRERVLTFVAERFPHFEIHCALSFNSGCREIEQHVFDVVVMDMSLPTFDKSQTDSGGRFRPFGGRELARKIVRRELNTKVVFLTQYQSFSDKNRSQSLDALSSELKQECGASYLGSIVYDSSKSAWRDELERALSTV